MEARHQITEAQFAAGRHYQALHEIAFARALHSLDLAAPVIDKGRYAKPPPGLLNNPLPRNVAVYRHALAIMRPLGRRHSVLRVIERRNEG